MRKQRDNSISRAGTMNAVIYSIFLKNKIFLKKLLDIFLERIYFDLHSPAERHLKEVLKLYFFSQISTSVLLPLHQEGLVGVTASPSPQGRKPIQNPAGNQSSQKPQVHNNWTGAAISLSYTSARIITVPYGQRT
jgi:hypothetical protein